jgi:uncharacterized protein (TIGR02246 family)
MRSWIVLTVWFAVTAMAVPVLGQRSSADEVEVRKLMASMVTAWTTGDAKALAAVYTMDADYASSTGFTANGRAEIEQAYVGQFSGVYKGTSLALTITNVRFLTPDVALVNAAFEVTGLRGPGGQLAPPRKGMNTSILIRTRGQWLMTAHRGWVPPAPATP